MAVGKGEPSIDHQLYFFRETGPSGYYPIVSVYSRTRVRFVVMLDIREIQAIQREVSPVRVHFIYPHELTTAQPVERGHQGRQRHLPTVPTTSRPRRQHRIYARCLAGSNRTAGEGDRKTQIRQRPTEGVERESGGRCGIVEEETSRSETEDRTDRGREGRRSAEVGEARSHFPRLFFPRQTRGRSGLGWKLFVDRIRFSRLRA